MGLLSFFSKPTPVLLRLPSGSFTVDRKGNVLRGTLPSSFPKDLVDDIAQKVRATFEAAAKAQLPLTKLVINYPSLRITAHEQRGGAFVILSPKAPSSPVSQS